MIDYNLVLCSITLVWFPDDDPLGIEICMNVQCDVVIEVCEEQYCAFHWSECCELVIDNARNELYKNDCKTVAKIQSSNMCWKYSVFFRKVFTILIYRVNKRSNALTVRPADISQLFTFSCST